MLSKSFYPSHKNFFSIHQHESDLKNNNLKMSDLLDQTNKNKFKLKDFQENFFAHKKHAALIILQGMDTSGKDGIIKHIFTGVNPQGVDVHSFGPPSPKERNHDFLWRFHRRIPERGKISIFNRSYYEETTVVKIHSEFLHLQNLPKEIVTENIFDQRFTAINNFEKYLVDNGILVLKFFLHISKDEQKHRLKRRLLNKNKFWKFAMSDIKERSFWDQYLDCYQDIFDNTHTSFAPWHIIPANNKKFGRLLVSEILLEQFRKLKLEAPAPCAIKIEEIKSAQALLQ